MGKIAIKRSFTAEWGKMGGSVYVSKPGSVYLSAIAVVINFKNIR